MSETKYNVFNKKGGLIGEVDTLKDGAHVLKDVQYNGHVEFGDQYWSGQTMQKMFGLKARKVDGKEYYEEQKKKGD